VCLLDVELGEAPSAVPDRARHGQPYRLALVLVRLHGTPLGCVEVPLHGGRLDRAELDRSVATQLGDAIAAHLRDDAGAAVAASARPRCIERRLRFLERAPPATVVVASRDGERTLAECLDSLLALDYPRFEIVVVDSASRGSGVATLVARYCSAGRIAYVREHAPGLALAHNRGLEAATGSVVAFTDDDVIVDRLWLAQLARGFEAAPQVACVTGPILPLELETPAQLWAEAYWGLGKGFERRVFDRRPPDGERVYPYAAGVFGSGANMAFRTSVLRGLGGFDPALGAGSRARGGDDLASFFDIVSSGHGLLYEPTALVRHRHRPDYPSLQRQAYAYGCGLAAHVTRTMIERPRRVLEVVSRAPEGLALVFGARSRKNARRPADFPRALTRAERRGMALGGLAYVRARRARGR
jgi:glycosyltransferase involved in cell wall biosynthesis